MESANPQYMESLTVEQQGQVFDIMAITNIDDTNTAAKLLIDANYDMNRAVQIFFDRGARGISSDLRAPPPQQQTGERAERPRAQGSDLHSKYRQFLENKTKEDKDKKITETVSQGINSFMFGMKSVWNTWVPTAVRGETAGGEQFTTMFKHYYPAFAKQLTFNLGTFDENVWHVKTTRRPLLVYYFVDQAEQRPIPFNLFKNKVVVEWMNNKFHLLGLMSDSSDAKATEKYVDASNYPCFAVYRINLVDEITLVEVIKLSLEMTAQQLIERLKTVHGTYWMALAAEDKVKKEVKNMMNNEATGNFGIAQFAQNEFQGGQMFPFFAGNQQNDYIPRQPQVDPVQQQRLEEDRILRQIQDEEYKEVERQILEQQMKETEEKKTKKEIAEQEEAAKKAIEEEARRKEEEKEMRIAEKLSSLPEEPAEGGEDVVLIIIRLPDGNRLERRFRNTDKVQVLYDYVDTKDVEFDKTTIRYDLMQPRPFVVLEDKEKTINEYFEGSNHEVIHIRELTE